MYTSPKVGDKVYVSNSMKRYATWFNWDAGERKLVFPWKTKLPKYPNIFDNRYKECEYTIREIIKHPSSGDIICLLSSNNIADIWLQIGIGGITTMTPEEYAKAEEIAKEKSLIGLTKENLNKWSKNDNLKLFPEELVEYLYDEDQKVLVGSHYSKGIVRYAYIPKQYTVDNEPLYLYTNINYNGKGCDLSDKQTIKWNKLKNFFSNV